MLIVIQLVTVYIVEAFIFNKSKWKSKLYILLKLHINFWS